MKIAIGLPAAVPGASGDDILYWAKAGEEAGFSSLAVIDRIVYSNVEPLIALAAAAGATSRIGLLTFLVVAPPRQTALFAKQVASLDHLSGGRVTLGVGIGGRADDYEVSGLTTRGRGQRLEEQIVACRRIWDGKEEGDMSGIGPPPVRPGGPEVIFGGATAGIERAARLGHGWMAGWPIPFDGEPVVLSGAGTGAVPRTFAGEVARLTDAWREHGREGRPKALCGCYFAFGDARDDVSGYLRNWYGFDGNLAEQATLAPITDVATARRYCEAFAKAGCDEFVLMPCSADRGQVEALADAVLS